MLVEQRNRVKAARIMLKSLHAFTFPAVNNNSCDTLITKIKDLLAAALMFFRNRLDAKVRAGAHLCEKWLSEFSLLHLVIALRHAFLMHGPPDLPENGPAPVRTCS